MFPVEIEQWLVATHLQNGVESLQVRHYQSTSKRVSGRRISKVPHLEKVYQELEAEIDKSLHSMQDRSDMELQAKYNVLQQMAIAKEVYPMLEIQARDSIEIFSRVFGQNLKPTKDEFRSFALRLLANNVQLAGIEKSLLQGNDYYLLEAIQQAATMVAQSKLPVTFGRVVAAYLKWYEEEKPNVKTFEKEVVAQCHVLLELLGKDTDISEINDHATISALKAKLRKWPVNKKKKFGDLSLATILRKGEDYQKISLETADKYFSRLVPVLDFALKRRFITGVNIAQGETVSTKMDRAAVLPHEKREAYSKADIERLVDALCTKPLSADGTKNERFWVILLVMLHSIRPGNILGLTQKHFIQNDNNIVCIDLGKYRSGEAKTADTRLTYVPVHPVLVSLGFLSWVDTRGDKLFTDSGRQFSHWYNRDEINKQGQEILGFEARYVTRDKRKCFYSLRHNFGSAAWEADVDIKAAKESMGHHVDAKDQFRGRYAGRTSPEKMLREYAKMTEYYKTIGLDVERLQLRAIELFPEIVG